MKSLQLLNEERAALLLRISQIEAVIAEFSALERRAEKLLATENGATASISPRTAKTLSSGESSGRRRSSQSVTEFEAGIRIILEDSSEPLDRSALLERAEMLSLPVGGAEPINTLASRMSRMKDVMNVRGKGYWLKSREHELGRPIDTNTILEL